MGINQGLISINGVTSWESFKMTDVPGISPSIGVLEFYVDGGLPPENCDIVLTYSDADHGLQTVTIPKCQLDAIFVEQNSGGRMWTARFMDERWAWSFREITGRYNIRLPDNWVNPDHEKTPAQLATLCFQALGVTNFDVSDLPNESRPDVDWDHANPAQELQKLCDDLGCRIVPIRSKSLWKICITGNGNPLPDQYPYNDAGEGVDPKEKPNFIKIVTSPWQYQVALRLSPIARDITNLGWKHISDLSYVPNPADSDFDYGFGIDHQTFEIKGLSKIRVRQADGTAISAQELAMQSVYRSWRIDDDLTGLIDNGQKLISIPGYKGQTATRKQLILSDQLVQTYVDDRQEEHRRPAFVWGQFWSPKTEGVGGDLTSPGTRIDFQAQEYKFEEERASFSLSIDPIDTDRSIVSISRPMVQPVTGGGGDSGYKAAKIFLTCAIQVRDPDTWQPVRFEYLYQVGNGTDKTFCQEIIKEEIQPWSIQLYDENGNPAGDPTNNVDLVTQQCDFFAKAYAKKFEIIDTGSRTYIGLFPIDMDGALQQVTYRIGKQGADTVVSRGTEHAWEIPTYEEQLQRAGRKSTLAQAQYILNRLNRQAAQKGTFNT